MNVKIKCDRCGKEVEGIESPVGTGGFYRVESGLWSKYKKIGETRICDSCMWKDEGYLKDYPSMRGVI